MITAALKDEKNKARTGVEGLDDILVGGLQRGRVYLIEGSPGTGKTTIATQFLLAGAEAGERGLYITLSETEDELRDERGIARLDARRAARHFRTGPAREPARRGAAAEPALFVRPRARRDDQAHLRGDRAAKPRRVVVDSLSEIRLLAQSSLRYRRQVLALKHYFARNGATV